MLKLLTGFLVGLVCLGLARGDTFYVSPVHLGDACSIDFPCSFQSALSKAENNGESDIIYVNPGLYRFNSTLTAQVRDGMGLSIFALDPSDKPVLDGDYDGDPSTDDRIQIMSLSGWGITVDGLVFRNGKGDNGGALFVAGEFFTIFTLRNSEFYGNEAFEGGGVYVISVVGRVLLLGNTFEGNSSGKDGGAVYTSCNESSIIERNTIRENRGDSIVYLMVEPSSDCSFSGNLVVNNTIYLNASLYSQVWSNLHLINNTFVGGEMPGVYVVLENISAELNLYNNLFWDTGSSVPAGRSLLVLANAGGVQLFNNLFGQYFITFPEADGTPDNSIESLGVYIKDLDLGRYQHGSNFTQDPQFVNAQAGDYRLASTSPAVDSGTSSLPAGAYLGSKDIDLNPRNIDGNSDDLAVVDIGALEYNPFGPAPAGGCSSVPSSSLFLPVAILFLLRRLLRKVGYMLYY